MTTNLRTALIFGGFISLIGAAFYPIYFRPLMRLEEYQKEQAINRAGIVQEDVQPPAYADLQGEEKKKKQGCLYQKEQVYLKQMWNQFGQIETVDATVSRQRSFKMEEESPVYIRFSLRRNPRSGIGLYQDHQRIFLCGKQDRKTPAGCRVCRKPTQFSYRLRNQISGEKQHITRLSDCEAAFLMKAGEHLLRLWLCRTHPRRCLATWPAVDTCA
ncbi:hypothetical protein EI555_011110 [Monodon monoceros]|uniref:Small integral membrane protein 20 n=1 Tax=Monodon monoceros TaxID=40151 RepID=A0A4U1FBH7_MONMO|nr:hypothetical protein EI555_011110 [Monodon monoceros]